LVTIFVNIVYELKTTGTVKENRIGTNAGIDALILSSLVVSPIVERLRNIIHTTIANIPRNYENFKLTLKQIKSKRATKKVKDPITAYASPIFKFASLHK